MLTRLKIQGFKKLNNVDVRFGPFTCLVGVSGTGKSTLLEAIAFLSALSQCTFLDAAASLPCHDGTLATIESLFSFHGNGCADRMSFEVEMVTPENGFDDYGMEVNAKNTFLLYRLTLGKRYDKTEGPPVLELIEESLGHINLSSASQHLRFPHKTDAWRYSAVRGRRSGGAFISTRTKDNNRFIELHADGDGGGRPRSLFASKLQRTVLSSVTSGENPTVLMAKREMQSWRRFLLEPPDLRKPDTLADPAMLNFNGLHLPSMIYQMNSILGPKGRLEAESGAVNEHKDWIYCQLTNILKDFGFDVQEVKICVENKTGGLELVILDSSGTPRSARFLPDGLCRLLALSAISMDKRTHSLSCLDEPENGIHPALIPLLVEILQKSVVDVSRAVGSDNPLRQMIVTTYSPIFLSNVPDDCILVADNMEVAGVKGQVNGVRFSSLPGTWRQKDDTECGIIERERIFPAAGLTQQLPAEQPLDDVKLSVGPRNARKPDIDQQSQPTLPYGDLFKTSSG
jgi:energy-coupling factor transporter ATP-binding protein EcfA2